MPIFYDNEANLVCSEDEHFYRSMKDPNIFYPSVTMKLNAYPKGYGFDEWLKQVGFNAEIILKKAGDQGTNVHNAIESLHKFGSISKLGENEMDNYTWDEWVMINRYIEFLKKCKPNILANEFKIVLPSWKVGGTIDCICEFNNQRWLIDFKTGNNIWSTAYIQTCVYAGMWDELNPQYKIDRIGILHLNSSVKTEGRNGAIQGEGWKLIEIPKPREHYLKLWEHTSALWDENNPDPKPKRMQLPIKIELKDII